MELNGALSNPQGALELFDLWSLKRALLQRKRSRRKERTDVPPRTCVPVTKTITEVLELANYNPMSAKDIHRACEELLGRPVGYRSVKNCLSKNAHGLETKFIRVGYGEYRLQIGPNT
jgi:hypothetical protein